ncbi:uncharacterized protein LOC113278718 [Papaver somniferum]|uniref:uncharacterized protein LOC113278718 n=1 Tax=Papaver somniferum TaxID=3469 RepID=UPI000E6F7E84|nr:uncharacterized protein LOC113278718 [Papaver somniferum]
MKLLRRRKRKAEPEIEPSEPNKRRKPFVFNYMLNDNDMKEAEAGDSDLDAEFLYTMMDLTKHNIGGLTAVCRHCQAIMWDEERCNKRDKKSLPEFNMCCMKGTVKLPLLKDTPVFLKNLLQYTNGGSRPSKFRKNIRAYNSMFASTSIGAKIKNHQNDGSAPWLYVYDTENEVQNRKNAISKRKEDKEKKDTEGDPEMEKVDNYEVETTNSLDDSIIKGLIKMFDNNNILCKTFRIWRDRYKEDQLSKVELRLISIGKRNAQQYNFPTTSEIAGLIVDKPEGDGTRDIIVDEKKSGLKNISELHPSYMDLQYPLLFLYGEDSFHTEIPYDKDNTSVRDDELGFEKKRKNITMRELKWVRGHQEEIRADVFQGIKEAVAAGDTEPGTAGRIILPSTFTGGPRQLGPPDLFIKFTCNPKWFEITEALKKIPGQQPIDRPDIVSRVFHIKLKALMSDLEGSRHFGEVQGAIYTVEFQKRGLPHAHILLWLKPEDKPKTATHVDSIIQDEFPDPEKDRVGYDAVCQYMLHGPCGAVKPNSPCMHHKKCSKKYPKKFCDKKSVDEKGYPVYRRQQMNCGFEKEGSDRVTAILETPATKKKTSNDSDISDPKESTSNVSDTVAPNNNPKPKFDEIKKYLDCRYLSASEAFWRTLNFEIHYRRPSVERLPFHLEGEQLIYHKDTEDLRDVLERTDPDATKFLRWMKANREHVKARNLTYAYFPSKWTWDTESKEWKPRKRGFNKIGRIYYVHPTAGEKYYLRILLNVQRGCHSYDDIKTVDCVTHLTFKAACLALGLLEDDGEWDHAIKEAATIYINGKILRELFVTLLLNCKVTEPKKLWSENWKLLADGIEHEHQKLYGNENLTYDDDDLKNYPLQEIELIMWKRGRTLKEDEFSEIPYPDMSGIDVPRNHLLAEETSYNRINLLAEAESLKKELNIKQKIVFHSVIDSVEKKDGGFFLCVEVVEQGKNFLAVASSGIASLLLPGVRTAHSIFKIPLRLNEQSCCNIFKKTNEADLLCRADLIIWDEAPMMHRNGLEAVQRTLADLMMEKNGGKELFGRKTLVLGGDFRKILSVIEEGSREEIVNASISRSKLWKHFKVFELTNNMRLLTGDTSVEKREEVEEFSKWVLYVGNGKLPTISLDGSKDTYWVEIPSGLLIQCQ